MISSIQSPSLRSADELLIISVLWSNSQPFRGTRDSPRFLITRPWRDSRCWSRHAHTQKHCAPARRLFEGAEWLAPVSEAIFKGCQWQVRKAYSGAHSPADVTDAQLCITFEVQTCGTSEQVQGPSLVHKISRQARSRRDEQQEEPSRLAI